MAKPRPQQTDVGVPIVGSLVAALALGAALNSYHVSRESIKADPYGVQLAADRLQAAGSALKMRGRVVYLSDVPAATPAGNSPFLAAQYALAPAFLVPVEQSAGVEWAIGNFSQPLNYASFGRAAGYSVVRDYGSGIVVFRRQPQ